MKLQKRSSASGEADAEAITEATEATDKGPKASLRGLGYTDAVQALAPGGTTGDVHAAAAEGISGSSGSLPHLDAIQRSFGHHDVSTVQAHTDAQAKAGASAMGAEAYATGNSVAFADTPSLHTAAHEAAHVVQQRAGVQLAGGVGAVGDSYEQHADAVADLVVQGKSAAALLDTKAGGGGAGAAGGGPVQRKLDPKKIEQYKAVLKIDTVSIVEMPKGGAKVTDKFSTFPKDSLHNVGGGLLDEALLSVEFAMPLADVEKMVGKEGMDYYGGVTAYDHLNDSNGGGAFIAPSELAVICEGASDRALLHEMGHSEQQQRLGAQVGGKGTTVNQIILEYHNVLLNENRYDAVEKTPDKDAKIRTFYMYDSKGKAPGGKSWETLKTDATKEYALNAKLLAEIRTLLDSDAAKAWGPTAEGNLIAEYYRSKK